MSSDDPTDDELEAEARRDSPLASGGSRHHSPKLGEVPGYAVDLRAMRPMLEAEREASDARMGHAVPDGRRVDPRASRFDWPDRPPPPPRPLYPYEVAPRADHERRPAEPVPSPLRALRGGRQTPEPEPAPTPYSPEAQAWDRFVSAALPLCSGYEQPEQAAATVADRLLELRRGRFG